MTGPPPGTADRGSASVLTLGVCAVVMTLFVWGVWLGAATVARQRAQAAADAGALAAAGHAWEGSAVACTHARRLVAANRGRVVSCVLDGLDALVVAETDAPVTDRFGAARATARAGPVRQPVGPFHETSAGV